MRQDQALREIRSQGDEFPLPAAEEDRGAGYRKCPIDGAFVGMLSYPWSASFCGPSRVGPGANGGSDSSPEVG